MLRRRIAAEGDLEFPMFAELREAAITDFVAILNRFAADGAIGEMDSFYSSWMTDRVEGFTDDEIAALKRLTPFLGLAIKSAVARPHRRDAGRDLSRARRGPAGPAGRIARGVADRIKTVLWFSDLRNYTRISDTRRPSRSFPCSTTMPTRSSQRSTSIRAMSSS